ncbi:MAG: ABC transporter ATP-binding protein [Candidatus Glassbacteria bacterium]|nr:ABC transporter ATP-binding protein [Candidatus Glassbacteria bacterium]
MNDRCLSAHGVEKDYPSGEGGLLRVLRGIDLTVENGSSICIVGPSGVGKSTLLHILGALEQPTRGEVRACGRAFFSLDDNRRSAMRNRLLGFVFQFHYLLAEFSAVENVAMPLLIRGVDSKQANEASSAILAEVGLAGRLHHRPAQLSGGEQQRVAVARALIHQPEFILADEPTGNLDKVNGQMVIDLLFEQLERRGMGFVLVTHDDSLAERAGRRYLLEEGKLHSLE